MHRTAILTNNKTNQNIHNPVENLFIVAKEPFRKHGVMNGILTGISYKDFQPASFKVVLSNHRLKEDDKLNETLYEATGIFVEGSVFRQG